MGLDILANEAGLVAYRVDEKVYLYGTGGDQEVLIRKLLWILRNRPGLLQFFPGIVLEEIPNEDNEHRGPSIPEEKSEES
jgi:hypothetical protein